MIRPSSVYVNIYVVVCVCMYVCIFLVIDLIQYDPFLDEQKNF